MKKKLSRREAIGGMLATGASILTLSEVTDAQTEAAAPAYAGKHQPRALPFDPAI
jgi:hypothetical protein